ncbi:alpha/beta fold hydrolase [bacterium]|nr:alpha/beta fold hydrolase [bacterium]
MLLHGFTGTPWVWEELAAVLSGHGIETSVPLLPGHGTSPEDLAATSWRQWVSCAEQAYGVLSERCEEVCIAGISMGGALALLLASRHPCSGVISLAAPVRLHGVTLHLIPLLKIFRRNWKKRKTGDIVSPEAGYDCYPLAGVQQFRQLLSEVRRGLGRITCPALIMHSRADKRIPMDNSLEIAKGIGSSRVTIVVLPSPGHTVTKSEDSRLVERTVLEFVSKTEKGKFSGTLL